MTHKIALLIAVVLLRPLVLVAVPGLDLDLSSELCPLQLQQANNDPMAGVAFLSETELVVYTVCHEESKLAVRDRSQATDPNHLKAVILAADTGAVKHRFDWPTHGRGSFLRVTHSRQLLLVLDNVLQLMKTDGTPLASMRIPKVGPGDQTFVSVSPAVDTIVVTLSSTAPGDKVVNGVALLDSRDLTPIAQWHEDGDWWNLVSSSDLVLRTMEQGKKLQVAEMAQVRKGSQKWDTVRSFDSAISKPVFVNNSAFAFTNRNSVFLSIGKAGQLDPASCVHADETYFSPVQAIQAFASREGKYFGALCGRATTESKPEGLGPDNVPKTVTGWVDVFSSARIRRADSVSLGEISGVGCGLAISPEASAVAFIDRLRLRLFKISN